MNCFNSFIKYKVFNKKYIRWLQILDGLISEFCRMDYFFQELQFNKTETTRELPLIVASPVISDSLSFNTFFLPHLFNFAHT